MEKYIFDERNGLWYELQDDYYLPCLKLPEVEQTACRLMWTTTLAVYQAKSQGLLS